MFMEIPNDGTVYVLVIFSASIIYFLYRFVESKWPDIYFTTSDKSTAILAMNPLWFFSFRFFPVFLTITLILSLLKEDSFTLRERVAAGFMIGLIHVFNTDVRALCKIFRRDSSIHAYSNKAGQILAHLLSIVLILVLSLLGGVVSFCNFTQRMTPTFQGVLDNIWSSVIIALSLFIISKLPNLIGNILSVDDIYKVSLEGIDSKILREINAQSLVYNVNRHLVKSICIVENLQRPKWLRKLERLKSFVSPRGTYGIMQVYSDRYVSDIQSVSIAMEKYFKDSVNLTSEEEVSEIISKYNQDVTYKDMVLEVYRSLLPPSAG